ncbi:MAG: 4'-phosphopantetheinyl transferase superfamily protein [Candidatus Hydrogenedentes bacterium]|nr:4'-phosphopantetheinyl transferase superfamily protein [Candidatus Hydrogenedentota bacterium]
MSASSTNLEWREPGPGIRLAPDEVHVWRARLDQPAAIIERFWTTLSADEQERAARFHFPGGRDSYVVGRGVLRELLGHYLGMQPCNVSFAYSDHGKPALAEGCGSLGLRFNLAHSGRLALYGFVLDHLIGIDIEKNRPDFAGQRIADRFFSPRESEALRKLPKEQREEAFLNCWTRKEAYIKARGEGLSFPLDAFDVSLKPGEPAALLATHGNPHEASRWSMFALHAEEGYAAALAVEGQGADVSCFDWHP